MATFYEFNGDTFPKDETRELFAQLKPNTYTLWAYEFEGSIFADSSDVTETTLYCVGENQHEDIYDANKELSDMFFDLTPIAEFGNDTVAMREAFNNWTDALCKDGEICDDTYNECELIEE